MGQNFDSNFWPLLSGSAADSVSWSRGTTKAWRSARVLSKVTADYQTRGFLLLLFFERLKNNKMYRKTPYRLDFSCLSYKNLEYFLKHCKPLFFFVLHLYVHILASRKIDMTVKSSKRLKTQCLRQTKILTGIRKKKPTSFIYKVLF